MTADILNRFLIASIWFCI